MELAIEALSLQKRYAEVQAVAGINLQIARGEYFGMLGPNGAGKTTTVAMIYCFLPIEGGELYVLDMDVRKQARAIKARLGVVPQENNLDEELTVLENLLIYASYFGIDRQTATKRALAQLEFFELTAKQHVDVEALSGGMKRRLTIARAMMNEPDILILDEPTTGLDPEARHYIWQHLKQLKKTGLTLLLTTHYLEEASQLCDRIVVLDEGRILEEGQPAALITQHVGATVIEATLPQREHDSLLQTVQALLNGYMVIGETLYLHPGYNITTVLAKVQEHSKVETLTQRPANLEDVFLKLTGRRFGGA
ncbi:MAG: ATP-binding cassette domain-containing protein [Firmicutes bacterium]|nr:ATP-binding cassette domain-containing protein [Bacillota bacterium]